MATRYDDDFYDQYEWVENQHGNSRPYWQLRDKTTGIFIKNELADPFHNYFDPDDPYDDC